MLKLLMLMISFSVSCNAIAVDLGVHGQIFPIKEQDVVEVIIDGLKKAQADGGLDKLKHLMIEKTKQYIQRPRGNKLPSAIKNRKHYYDPTFVVPFDLKDHKGRVFHKKGEKVNPLEIVKMQNLWVLFDGDDKTQVNWALKNYKSTYDKLILTNGSPIALSEEFKRAVYFDQGRYLVNKLKVKHLPARVSQKGTKLLIEEIALQKTNERGENAKE